MWDCFLILFIQMMWRDVKRSIHKLNEHHQSSIESRGGGGYTAVKKQFRAVVEYTQSRAKQVPN